MQAAISPIIEWATAWKEAGHDPVVDLVGFMNSGEVRHGCGDRFHVATKGFAFNPLMHETACFIRCHAEESRGSPLQPPSWRRTCSIRSSREPRTSMVGDCISPDSGRTRSRRMVSTRARRAWSR